MISILTLLIGKGAFKAWGGGLGAAGAVLLNPFLEGLAQGGGVAFRDAGVQIGAALGAFVVGYVVTWFAPKNKPS